MLFDGCYFNLMNVSRVNLRSYFAISTSKALQSVHHVINGHGAVINISASITECYSCWFCHDEVRRYHAVSVWHSC